MNRIARIAIDVHTATISMTTPDLSPAPRHLLRVQAGPTSGQEYPLTPGKVTLGRDQENDIVLEDDSVSPRHARLDFSDGGWRLTDLCSTNGTRVDGERLPEDTPTPLPEGTQLSLGGVKLLLEVQEEPEETEEVEEEAAAAGAAEPASAPQGPEPGAGVHAPVSGTEPTGTPTKRRMKLPLWLVVLVILVIVIIAIVLIAAAPAGLATAQAALLIDNVLLPPPTPS